MHQLLVIALVGAFAGYPLIEYVTLPTLLYPGTIVGLALLVIATRGGSTLSRQSLLWLCGIWVYGLLFVIGLVWTSAPQTGLEKVISLGYRVVLPCTALALARLEMGFSSNLAKMMILVSVAVGIVTFGGPAMLGFRLVLPGSNPIWVGRSMALGCVSAMHLWGQSSSLLKRMFYVVLTVFFIVVILLTGSRAPALSALMGITVTILWARKAPCRRQGRKTWSAAIISAVLAIIVLLAVMPLIRDDLAVQRIMGFAADSDASIEGRLSRIRAAMSVFATYPLFGGGPASSGQAFSRSDVREYPHNVAIETIAETGVLGFCVFIVLLVLGCRPLTLKSPDVALLAGMFVSSFANSMASGDVPANEMLWISMALALSLRQVRHERAIGDRNHVQSFT